MNLDPKQEIPSRYISLGAIAIALLNTTLVLPFDCVKTHLEKRDPTQTYINSFRTIYKQGGLLAFYTGFRIRFLMYFINSLLVVNLLEKLENIAAFLKVKKN